jgi:hypothetical protein
VGSNLDEAGAIGAGAMAVAFGAHGLVHLGKRKLEHRTPSMHDPLPPKGDDK